MAQSIFEVLVQINGINYSLELDQTNEAISFDYQISDVRDISSRQQAKTLSLSFPYNTHNALVFDNILSVNAASLNFDPNIKSLVSVLVDTIEVFTGYLQVTDGTVNLNDEVAYINCTLISNNIDFWQLVGEGYISDMDFSEFNHIYGATAQMASWYSDYTNGYFYPLIDYGYGWNAQSISGQPTINTQVGLVQFNNVLPSQLYPATYVKTIWDKIFLNTSTVSTAPNGTTYSTQPYQYTSTFLTESLFENLLVPFTKGNFVQSISPTFSFIAGVFTTTNGRLVSYGGQTNVAGPFSVTFDDTTLPYGNDPYGYWDTSNYWYTNSTGEYLNTSFQCSVTTQISTYSVPGIGAYGMANQVNAPIFAIYREFDNINGVPSVNPGWAGGTGAGFPTGANGESIWTPQSNPQPANWATTNFQTLTQQWNFTSYPLDNGGYQNEVPINGPNGIQYTFPFRYPLFPNERIRLTYMWVVVNTTTSAPFDFNFSVISSQNTSYPGNLTQIELVQNQQITIGQTINYSGVLPTNIKKKDFFSWIMRMFNLYIEPSKTLSNTLIIEPRDRYYTNGQILDWSPSGSNKLDTNQEIGIEILSNTQDRSTAFTYTDDKDYYNSEYKQLWQQTYGYFRYIRENQFSTDDGSISVGFSPTPLVQIPQSDIVIPVFDKVSYQNQTTQISNTDVNIRIVQRNPTASGFVSYSGGTNWAYAYGAITTQTQFTFDPTKDSYQGNWSAATNYFVGNIVQDNVGGNGNYYICTSNVVGTSYASPVGWNAGTWYTPGTVVEFFLSGSGHNEYYICLHSNALIPAGPFGHQGLLEAHDWQDYGSSPPSGNSSPAGDPSHWLFFSNGILTGLIDSEAGYPYVGHFDNPYAPSVDINWSQTEMLFYDSELITDASGIGNNLINIFYANQLAQQSASTSKMVTCMLYLTPQDINQFYFNSKIYLEIDGEASYYYVNAIKGFDPSQYKTTQVELLSASDITVNDINPIAQESIIKGGRKSFVIQSGGNNITNNSNGIVVGTQHNISGSGIIVSGIGNGVVSSQNTLVLGQAGFISGVGNSVVIGNSTQIINSGKILSIGDNNYLQQGGTKMLNVGDNNSISPYSENIYIFGDNTLISTTQSGSSNIFSRGNNNLISSTYSLSNVFLAGDYITVSGTASDVTVFGSNIIATQSGTFYLNQIMVAGPSGSISPSIITGTPDTMAVFNTVGRLTSFFVVDVVKESLAIGSSTLASGLSSFAEGGSTIASGNTSHAEGASTLASGLQSHAEGFSTIASGNVSHAEGGSSEASGAASHAGGASSKANNWGEWARGSNAVISTGQYQYGIMSYIGDSVPITTTELFLDGSSIQFQPLVGIYYMTLEFIASSTNATAWFPNGTLPIQFILAWDGAVLALLNITTAAGFTTANFIGVSTGATFLNPTLTVANVANQLIISSTNAGTDTYNIMVKMSYTKVL